LLIGIKFFPVIGGLVILEQLLGIADCKKLNAHLVQKLAKF